MLIRWNRGVGAFPRHNSYGIFGKLQDTVIGTEAAPPPSTIMALERQTFRRVFSRVFGRVN